MRPPAAAPSTPPPSPPKPIAAKPKPNLPKCIQCPAAILAHASTFTTLNQGSVLTPQRIGRAGAAFAAASKGEAKLGGLRSAEAASGRVSWNYPAPKYAGCLDAHTDRAAKGEKRSRRTPSLRQIIIWARRSGTLDQLIKSTSP